MRQSWSLVVLLVLVAVTGVCSKAPKHHDDEAIQQHVEEHFHRFKQRFDKRYGTAEEGERRLGIFRDNLNIIEQLRAEEEGSAKYDVNKFSDMTFEEFRDGYLKPMPLEGIHKSHQLVQGSLSKNAPPIPQSFDWRDLNAVTAPENLGACDSSWIASAVQAVESAWYLAGHDLVQLSTQQVVDCFNDPTTAISGCKGGDIQKAYQYISDHGLQLRSDYPYRASQSKCNYNSSAVVAKIDGYLMGTANRSELQMQYSLLEYGPLALCLDAGYRWQFYAGGVISHLCGETINHCVLLTGYKDYYEAPWGTYEVWNLKNNWGKDWGEGGYVYVERGNDVCGVAKMATIPIITPSETFKRRAVE